MRNLISITSLYKKTSKTEKSAVFLLTLTIFLLLLISCNQQYSHKPEHYENIKIDASIFENELIKSIIEPYRDSLEFIMNEVIGVNKTTIRSEKPDSPLSSFVADLILQAGKEFLERQNVDEHPIISVMNVRGLRAPMPAGEITVRNAFEIMPFENQLVAVLLNGRQIEELFHHIASINGDGIAGATFTIHSDRAENIRVHNRKPESDSLYWVITSDFLAAGGDHYTIFQESKLILTSAKTIRELIIEHIRTLTKNDQIIKADRRVRIKTETGDR